jgi:hypothetical protein
LRRSSPFTVAGQWRIYTPFPFNLKSETAIRHLIDNYSIVLKLVAEAGDEDKQNPAWLRAHSIAIKKGACPADTLAKIVAEKPES